MRNYQVEYLSLTQDCLVLNRENDKNNIKTVQLGLVILIPFILLFYLYFGFYDCVWLWLLFSCDQPWKIYSVWMDLYLSLESW